MTTKIVSALSSAEADIIVLPELAFTGYFFQDRSELASLAKEYFDPGNTPLKTIELRGVKIGIMVCFDWAFPEVARVPDGKLIHRAKSEKEELFIAKIDVTTARNKWITQHNELLEDRRPEYYTDLV